MIKAVLFDFDGTLADTLPYYIKAYHKALDTIGFHFSDEEVIKQCFGVKEYIICEKLGVPKKTEEFTRSYFDAVKTLLKNALLFKDTIPTLIHLKEKGIKIAVITYAYRWYIDLMIAQFNLAPFVDLSISADEVLKPKPDPEAILKATTFFHIKPEETIMIGDSKSDILMGKTAGSKSILMHPNGYERYYDYSELKKSKPDFIVQNLHELIALI
ncbi:MAG: HAD family hydrolase [Candidatus Roizmanbacteria bacterium]|nr:HAD family hydrolase [Candidatus Roizmanbacteria bacterium]